MKLLGRESPVMYFLARRCLRFLKKFENLEYRLDRNGERWLLNTIGAIKPSVIVDVGCNKGDWAACAREHNPQALIFAFEIIPDIAKRAQSRFAEDPKVKVFDVGLGNRFEDVNVYFNEANTEITSLYPPSDARSTELRAARMVRADAFFAEQDINSIDFLKIDVEGAENLVLKGIEPLLRAHAIRAIQFEYGFVSVHTRFLLSDYYALFEQFGYKVGKLYQCGVAFKPFERQDENFWGPNYVAIHCDDHELTDLIGLQNFKPIYAKRRKLKSAGLDVNPSQADAAGRPKSS